ncbi:MAG: repeat-containing protein, partial [Enterovirga sp.]|nr:repeat-containing protein [Enterovirga sp.]
MFHLGRWSGPSLGRLIGRLAPFVIAFGLAAGAASAREVVVTGANMNRFGRILLTFDQPTKVSARVTNAVLIITFADSAKVKTEKLALEMAPYITTVRRDPDGTGLRLALTGPVKANVLEAAERVFIDLLPPNWTGLLPGLPTEVVAELAARVAQAEAKLKAAAPRAVPAKVVRLRMAELPAMTRLQFDMPEPVPVQIQENGDEVELTFSGPVTFEDGGAKPKLAAGIAAFDPAPAGTGLRVRVKRAPGYVLQSFREPDGLVLDVAKPLPPQVLPEPAAFEPAPEAAPTEPAPVQAKAEDRPPPPPAPPQPAAPAAATPTSAPAVSAPATIVARVETGPDGASLVFPFRTRTPAAAYVRAGALTLVFDSQDRLDTSALAGSPDGSLRPIETTSDGTATVLRFPEAAAASARFVAEGSGWRLATGNPKVLPPDALKVSRGSDDHGRARVRVGLADGSRVHWMRDPDGARVGIVTAAGRPQALPLARSFVEFVLAPTLHGVVVEARADDVSASL